MMAFIKIVAEINKSRVLAVYRGHPGLLQRIPRFRVQLGFGLHAGWAIEGAVGSEFKIDASYLSPNVNIAKSVERATAIYDVPLLVAQSVVELCTKRMADKCRLIDRVVIKGQSAPMELYSVDLD